MKMHHHPTPASWIPNDVLPLLDDEVDDDMFGASAMRFISSDGSPLHDSHLPVEEFDEELYA